MGGTFIRLVEQGHDVHVAYETSGNVAVHDDVVIQDLDTARELGLGDRVEEVRQIIATKRKGEPEPRALLDIKGGIRRAEVYDLLNVGLRFKKDTGKENSDKRKDQCGADGKEKSRTCGSVRAVAILSAERFGNESIHSQHRAAAEGDH
jgi:hypothetical protein